MKIKIDGIPVPWAAHGGFGRRSFNPRYKEREYTQWVLRSQWGANEPLACPVCVDFVFEMPMPVTSKIKRAKMISGQIRPGKRPDRGNMLKFYEDCLIGIVIVDDSLIVDGYVRKIYSEHPQTVIIISPIEESGLGKISEPQ